MCRTLVTGQILHMRRFGLYSDALSTTELIAALRVKFGNGIRMLAGGELHLHANSCDPNITKAPRLNAGERRPGTVGEPLPGVSVKVAHLPAGAEEGKEEDEDFVEGMHLGCCKDGTARPRQALVTLKHSAPACNVMPVPGKHVMVAVSAVVLVLSIDDAHVNMTYTIIMN